MKNKGIKLLLTLLFLYSSSGFSQVIKYKAILFETDRFNNKKIDPPDRSQCNFLVVINLDKSKIQLYSNKYQDFDIVKVGKIVKTDEGNDIHQFSCVDIDGEQCILGYALITRRDSFDATLLIEYEKTTYQYYLKND
jgi:hypothetical protein